MPIVVKRRQKESVEKLLKRFNREVQLSRILSVARKKERREKEPTRKERRLAAIQAKKRKEAKMKRLMYLSS